MRSKAVAQGHLLGRHQRAALTFSPATNQTLIDNFADVHEDKEWKLSALVPQGTAVPAFADLM